MGLNLIGTVSLDGSGFERGLNKMSSAANGFSSNLKGLLAGAFSIAAFKELIVGAMETADKIDRLSKVYGISTKTLQEWNFAAYMSDTNLEALTKSFKKFASAKLDALRDPTGTAADNMKLLGITAERLKNADPAQVMYEIANAMVSATEDSDKFAAALKVLGKSADDVLPALKMLAEGGGKNAPVLSDSQIKTLTAESDRFKEFWTTTKGAGGGVAAWLSDAHISLGNLIDDAKALVSIPFNRLFDKSRTWADQSRDEKSAYVGRRSRLDALRYPGESMVFDRNAPIASPIGPQPAESEFTVAELVDINQKLRRAKELFRKSEDDALTAEERKTELVRDQLDLAKRIEKSKFGEGYADDMLKFAENEIELVRLEQKLKTKDEKRTGGMEWSSGDALVRVGNFLGASRNTLERLTEQSVQYMRQIADNTSRMATAPATSDAVGFN